MSVTTEPGDPQAGARTTRLYERHARPLYGVCLLLLRDPHEAEDALQSTFLAAHGALVRGGVPRDEVAWLAAIARNECRGRIRGRMDTPTHDDPALLDELPDPAAPPSERLVDPRVRHALAALSESQREAVLLRDVLGLRTREVGELLGVSRPAVEALLFRALRQVRLRLRPVGMLVVPAAVGHALAEAIPGFVAPAAAAGIAGSAGEAIPGFVAPAAAAGIAGSAGGAAGAGLLAKLTAAPAAAKVAAGVAAVATAGSVAVVEVDRQPSARPTVSSRSSTSPAALEAAGGTTTRGPRFGTTTVRSATTGAVRATACSSRTTGRVAATQAATKARPSPTTAPVQGRERP